MRYFLKISYDGTNYFGWQRQNNHVSIQEVIETEMSKFLRSEISILGSSRTDTGVHANVQYAHVDLETKLPDNFLFRLNRMLPEDIALQEVILVPEKYHARFDALSRYYIYRIARRKNVLTRFNSYLFEGELDIEKMQKACKLLLGEKDFSSFSKVKTNVNTFICTISQALLWKNGDILEFHIEANRFLRGMVRAIVGTLLDVGTGRTSVEEFQAIILAKNRSKAGPNVLAKGLTLENVIYPIHYFSK